MLAQDLIAALDYLGISPAELPALTGEAAERCTEWVADRAPVPHWLDQLVFCWCEHPDTLDMARDGALAGSAASPRAAAMGEPSSILLN